MFKFVNKNLIITSLLLVTLYGVTLAIIYLAFTTEYAPADELVSLRLMILVLFLPIIFKYVIQLLIAPLYQLVELIRRRKYSNDYLPSVSVLIPAWNEEVGVVKTIESVINTKYPKLEVIVINDGSTDNTDMVIKQFMVENPTLVEAANLRYLSKENGGKAETLNIGLAAAKNEIIITTDADSVMDSEAIIRIVQPYADPKVAAAAGNVTIGNKGQSIGFIQQLEYLYGFYFKRADSVFNSVYIVGGAAASYRASVIREVGGFDGRIITEDIELSTRLLNLGYNVRYVPDAITYTEGPADLAGLCRQRLRWKYGRLLTFYKHRNLFFSFDRKHKFYLSFILLPISLFAEFLLMFEGLLLLLFFTYTFYTNDFVPLVFVIVLLSAVISLQVLTDPKRSHHLNLLLLAPIAWLLFYFMDAIEFQALVRSIRRLVTKSELKWQRWQRRGVFLN